MYLIVLNVSKLKSLNSLLINNNWYLLYTLDIGEYILFLNIMINIKPDIIANGLRHTVHTD